MKSNSLEFESALSVEQLGQALNRGFTRLKAKVERVSASSNPLDSLNGSPDVAVVGTGQSLLGGGWAVHAYVTDLGTHRHVELVALGDSGFTRAFDGIRNSLSLGKSSEKMAQLADDLRSEDRDPRPV